MPRQQLVHHTQIQTGAAPLNPVPVSLQLNGTDQLCAEISHLMLPLSLIHEALF